MEEDEEKSDDPSDHHGGIRAGFMNTKKAIMQTGAVCLKALLVVLIVLGIIYLGQMTYRYSSAVFGDQAYEEEPGIEKRLEIPDSVTVKEIAEILEKNGLIEDADIFRFQMKFCDFGNTVEAGEYVVNSSMKPSEIAKVLLEKK